MQGKTIRNLIVILILGIGLAFLLYLEPWNRNPNPPPNIHDRLPDATIIGKSDVLDLSRSLSKTLFYYKLPFRDFLSPDFILSQGKSYGLDVQSPAYFFVEEHDNELEDWGIMLSVRDSSKIQEGITHLKKFIDLEAFQLFDARIYKHTESETYLTYGDDWIFLYGGPKLEARMERVLHAKFHEISSHWRKFLDKSQTMSDHLLAQINTSRLDEFGIKSAFVALHNDSSSLIFNTRIDWIDSIPFQLRNTGPAYAEQEFTNKLINLHMDVNKLKREQSGPMYEYMKKQSQKIGFPLKTFLNAWEGDVAFRQGGFQIIKEKYITSELDENFNVTEVEKYRDVKVLGFALHLSMNEHVRDFTKELLNKGILTKESPKYRLLYSPPLHMKINDSSLVFHTGRFVPEVFTQEANHIQWTVNYTPVNFYIDSTSAFSVFGRVQLPLKKIVSDNMAPISGDQ